MEEVSIKRCHPCEVLLLSSDGEHCLQCGGQVNVADTYRDRGVTRGFVTLVEHSQSAVVGLGFCLAPRLYRRSFQGLR